jgi:hypothetical protein
MCVCVCVCVSSQKQMSRARDLEAKCNSLQEKLKEVRTLSVSSTRT